MGIITCVASSILKTVINNLSPLLVFTAVFLFTKFYIINTKRGPPGPWGLPIIGYFPFLGKSLHDTVYNLSKKYGPILQLSFGVKKIVFLNDPELIRQTFNREEFTGRPDNKLYEMFQGNGIVNIEGDKWKAQKRFLHEHLRALGMKLNGPGREYMESGIMNEVESLLHSLACHEGKPMNVDEYLRNSSANVICNLMMSETFHGDNPQFERFMILHQVGFELWMKADMANYIPLYSFLPTVKNCTKQIKQNHQEAKSILKGFVCERRKNFDPSRTRDIIDAYLHKEHSAKLEGKELDDSCEEQLLQVMADLFGAGQETVKMALNWCLVYLLCNKDVATKVQKELDNIVGRSRLPSLDDMSEMPYTEATICEVLRRSSVVPLGTPHATTCDTQIGDYFIPAATTVFPNIYSCHMDPKIWSCPEKFDPSRFLDADGKVVKPKEFMPFGVGRRICLGQILARSELFLFISSILHVFDLEFGGDEKPSLESATAAAVAPKPYKIRFVPREISVLSSKDTLSSPNARGI